MTKEFYVEFERLFRGDREEIKERLMIYAPLLKAILQTQKTPLALDLGCGRGEWLEILSQNGFDALGVDIDEGMLSECDARGLNTKNIDALAALRETKDGSLSIISGFHIIEHLPFADQFELMQEAHRALSEGGILILETPNPENITVATHSFYTDPTHQRPVPSELLSFLAKFCGFYRTKTLRLQESKQLSQKADITLSDILKEASPDYAIVAQKEADQSTLSHFSHFLNQNYGISSSELADKFDNRLHKAIERQKSDSTTLQELAARHEELLGELNSIKQSYIWKLAYPHRLLFFAAKQILKVLFYLSDKTIKGRKRELLKKLLLRAKQRVAKNPKLKNIAKKALSKFPYLYSRLKNLSQPYSHSSLELSHTDISLSHLSPRAREIYKQLTSKNQKHG